MTHTSLDGPGLDLGVPPRRGWVLPALVVLVASLLLGGATSFGQGLLPQALQPFANSVSGWTILTALLVWVVRRELVPSAVLGATSFVGLVLGYTVMSDLRGFFFSPLFWAAVGLLAGPVVGVAAAALHRRGRQPAVGTGVLAGILLGDAARGLTVVAATTGCGYWAVVGVLGLALLVTVAVRRLRTAGSVLLATGVTLGVAMLAQVAFAGLDALLGAAG